MSDAFELGKMLNEQGGWGVAAVCLFIIWRMWLYIKELQGQNSKLGLESVKTMVEINRTLDTVGGHVKANCEGTSGLKDDVRMIRERLKTVVEATTSTSRSVAKLCGRKEA